MANTRNGPETPAKDDRINEETEHLPAVQEEAEPVSRSLVDPAAIPEWPADREPLPESYFRPGADHHEEWVGGPPPPVIAGEIDVAEFVKAQSAFVAHQSHFLREGRHAGEDYVVKLTGYSHAQDDYIFALHRVLHDLGVM